MSVGSVNPVAGTEQKAAPATTQASRAPDRLAMAVLLAAVVILFLTSPRQGDFWWADSSRHAMDGLFFHDFFRDLPLSHPVDYAMDYYVRSPALSVLFYPPLFALVEALFFALFGVSHGTAVLTVSAFYLAAGLGAYWLSRRWFGPAAALAVSLLLIGAPEVALWGRQVMLEIPSLALLLWSGYFLFRYLDREQARDLHWTALFFCCAMYTKQTVLFIAPVFAWALWESKGRRLLRDRQTWICAGWLALSMLPLLYLTLRFGHVNVNSVEGGDWTEQSRFSLQAWTYYLRALPGQFGWLPLGLGVVGVAASVFREWRRGASEAVRFNAIWIGAGYLFFSYIALREPRHTVVLLFPLAVFAVRGLAEIVPSRWIGPVAIGVATLAFAYTIRYHDVPRVGGYRETVDRLAPQLPSQGVVLFNGYRDGNFIFNLRSRYPQLDVSVLRADKLLLRVVQRRELSLSELSHSEAEIGDMLNRYGVSLVVNQANFWDDLQAMKRLQRVLRSSQFRKIGTFPIHPTVPEKDRELEVYENLGPVAKGSKRLSIELPMVGITVTGGIGNR